MFVVYISNLNTQHDVKTEVEDMSENKFEPIRNAIKKLQKKPKIPGITGFWRELILDFRAGIRDGKHNQVKEDVIGCYVSPLIHKKVSKAASYVNHLYLEANEALGEMASRCSSMIMEIHLLQTAISEMDNMEDSNYEINERRKSRIEESKNRCRQMLTDLAEAIELIHTFDNVVEIHAELAINERNASINRYWRGILKKSPIEALKSKPVYEEVTDSDSVVFKDKVCKLTCELESMIGGNLS